jgi:hypothetical protein
MPVTIPHAVDLGFGPQAKRFVDPQQTNLLRRSQYENLYLDVIIVRVNCGPQGVKLSKALKYE